MKRHTCKKCGAKRNEDKMSWNYVGDKTGWYCEIHFTEADKTDIVRKAGNHKPEFVELFAGSKEISQEAERLGYNTTTIDIEEKFEPDICIDILNLRRSMLPVLDVVKYIRWLINLSPIISIRYSI